MTVTTTYIFFRTLHWIHISFGFVAFFVAPIALIAAKGGLTHRRWGRVYFWSMVVVASTAIVLAIHQPNYFLACVSVFSFYLAFRGYRALVMKPTSKGSGGPKTLDWIGLVLALLGSTALLVLGIIQPGRVWVILGPVAVVFGVVGLLFACTDLYQFLFPPRDKMNWWYSHMSGMIASYIAAVSAFSVNNLRFLPVVVRWLWPTIIGAPLIFLWVRFYKKKFRKSA